MTLGYYKKMQIVPWTLGSACFVIDIPAILRAHNDEESAKRLVADRDRRLDAAFLSRALPIFGCAREAFAFSGRKNWATRVVGR